MHRLNSSRFGFINVFPKQEQVLIDKWALVTLVIKSNIPWDRDLIGRYLQLIFSLFAFSSHNRLVYKTFVISLGKNSISKR